MKSFSLYIEGLLLLALSALTAFGSGKSAINPTPFYFYFLVLFFSYLAIFLLPLTYIFLVSLLKRITRPEKASFALVGTISILDIVDIYISYNYGLIYRGPTYTWIVILENLAIFLPTLLLAIYGLLKRSVFAAHLSIFALFAALSWCAFPYLGEMP